MKDPKTTVIGFVLMACGAYLAIQAKHATPEALAMITSGAGFIVAADGKKASSTADDNKKPSA